MTELPWDDLMACAGVLGWSMEAWGGTTLKFLDAAMRGYRRANGGEKDDPPSAAEMQELALRYPDKPAHSKSTGA